MIFFWDKNVPRTIPQALKLLTPRVDGAAIGIEIYLDHFPLSDRYQEGGDDLWLSIVGNLGWFVITQDSSIHKKEQELYALKQYGVGCFYLWGAEAPKWEIMRCFARAYDRILDAARDTERPFIYSVARTGSLKSISLLM